MIDRQQPKPNPAARRSTSQSRQKKRRGAAAVEAALLSPLLMIVALGAIDIGQFINVAQSQSNASRVGTREACRNATTSQPQVETAVKEYLAEAFPNLTTSELDAAVQVSVHHADGTPIANGDLSAVPSGEQIYVHVTLDFDAVRWLGAIDYWQLNLEPVDCYGRRE